ncbi:MAG: selenide, water dikinase SelD [Alcanivoracaceae bacterium]|nr:selenide, water dikinase SelD [Alcanivoracaceae bacterium]
MKVKLTQYSHGAGCGCKISPKDLDIILKSKFPAGLDANLLVGNASKDDAAVYDLGDGTAVISTTDFFMPIVDDPAMFGQIAATNAISDVYAMGGRPLMAIAILGWPLDKLPAEVAAQVIDGARQTCKEAGIQLAGGHSIDSPEPIFGLAVTGLVNVDNIKKNNTAKADDLLYLSKPLGIGILSTAQKQGKLKDEHQHIGPDLMCQLNTFGQIASQQSYIHAMTDVTGFALLGHLQEMCQGSQLGAQLHVSKIPIIPEALQYLKLDCVPGGTHRNWQSYGEYYPQMPVELKNILCDPQTSGGLLMAVAKNNQQEFEELALSNGLNLTAFGQLTKSKTFIFKA